MLPYWMTSLAVAAVVGGNLLLRAAWLRALPAGRQPLTPRAALAALAKSWRLAAGLALLLIGVVGWIVAVSVWRLDWGYVAFGLSFVVTILCAWWFIGETLTLEKMFGAIIIVIGMLLIVRNSGL